MKGAPPLASPRVVWADLRQRWATDNLCSSLAGGYCTQRLTRADQLHAEMKKSPAELMCFEYDYPDLDGLKALQDAKRQYPFTPIIMLTEQHSEALAIWALRTRVWDYLVKPLSDDQLCSSIASVFRRQPCDRPDKISPPPWAHALPAPLLPELHVGAGPRPARITQAISYVENNYSAKIPLQTVAKLCGLGPFQFSRIFKRENGITFREFLLQYRIHRAADLFKNPRASVTDVAFTVGFSDLSYFARMFRRYTGSLPSEFRTSQQPIFSKEKKEA